MKYSTTLSHRIRLIVGIIVIIMTIGVNALSLSMLIKQSSQSTADHPKSSPAEKTSSEDVIDTETEKLFGSPASITVKGNGKKLTFAPGDEAYEKLLELNERRAMFTPSLSPMTTAMTDSDSVYYMEFAYDNFLPITWAEGEAEADRILFALTGQSHGSMKLYCGDEVKMHLGKLAIEPELILYVIELLG